MFVFCIWIAQKSNKTDKSTKEWVNKWIRNWKISWIGVSGKNHKIPANFKQDRKFQHWKLRWKFQLYRCKQVKTVDRTFEREFSFLRTISLRAVSDTRNQFHFPTLQKNPSKWRTTKTATSSCSSNKTTVSIRICSWTRRRKVSKKQIHWLSRIIRRIWHWWIISSQNVFSICHLLTKIMLWRKRRLSTNTAAIIKYCAFRHKSNCCCQFFCVFAFFFFTLQ